MDKRITMHVLRVFVNEQEQFGNPVGIVVDEKNELNSTQRQKLTTSTGFSECVFINDVNAGQISIFNPQHEVKFAGHALVGTAHFIKHVLDKPLSILHCKGGDVQAHFENDLTWIDAGLDGTPPWQFNEVDGVDEVEDILFGKQKKYEHTVVWSWINEANGTVRARTFAPDWGIPEDEANGSGSMQLAARLNRKLEIHHGKGSLIYARPTTVEKAGVGGNVMIDDIREFDID